MMHSSLIRHIFLLYCIISGLVGVSIISLFITLVIVALLETYKLSPASLNAVKKVLDTDKTSIIAHRGAGNDAPENTIAAFRKAKENGADAIEFDLEFSKDGVAVIFHDDKVDRTTDGQGDIRGFTYQQLQQFNAAAKHPLKDQFPNERIPTLDETVKVCLELGLKMYFDVKGDAASATETITSMFKKYPTLYDNAVVCSFWPQVPYKVKRADNRIVTGLTHRHRVLTRKVDGTERTGPLYKKLAYPLIDIILEWSMHSWLWYFCGTSAFLGFVGDVSVQMVESYAAKGIHVVLWTSNSNVEKRYITEKLKCSYMTDTLSEAGCEPQRN